MGTKKPVSQRKTLDLQDTQIWRESANTIVLAGDFDPINIRRTVDPRSWDKLDRFLRAHGK